MRTKALATEHGPDGGLSIVIGGSGEIVWPGCGDARPSESGLDRDDAVAAEVIEHGHVEWLVREGHVRIRLRPSMTSSATLAVLTRWLGCRLPERVLIAFHIQGLWHYEYVRSGHAALECIGRAFTSSGGAAIKRRARPLRAADAGLADTLSFWHAARDQFDPSRDARTLRILVSDRFVLLKAVEPANYRIEDFGAALPEFARMWLGANIGRPIATLPDAEHGRYCAKSYACAQMRCTPYLEDVDTFVTWPGLGRRRQRYSRMLLPFKSRDAAWMLSATRIDPSIDLRG